MNMEYLSINLFPQFFSSGLTKKRRWVFCFDQEESPASMRRQGQAASASPLTPF